MMNIVIVSKYILKLRIKHKQLEHVVYQIQSQKLIKHNFGNNYNSNRTKHCNPIINKKKKGKSNRFMKSHSIIFIRP